MSEAVSNSQAPRPIDASCRLPLFTLFGGAALWLVLSSVFGLAASMTFHQPSLFADCAVFTYGRAYPAWSHLLVYGFALPSGLGVGLWLLARLGRVTVAQPFLIAVGAKLWHLGVLVGLIAILAGQTSGHEWLELPRYAAVILFLAFVLMALGAFVTYSRRAEESLYPSQWFVLAALFWFPWIFSTALLLLQVCPVRGITQAAVAWWFAGNLLNVWLTLAGLAATFYLLPKLTERSLQSHYLALFVLWTVMLFGAWTGIPAAAPLPAWMSALSGVATALLIVPALALATIIVKTCCGAKEAVQSPKSQAQSQDDLRTAKTLDFRPETLDSGRSQGGPLCYARAGAWMLVFTTFIAALAVCPAVARVTDFTWFAPGQLALRLYGFFALTIFAAIYHILPRISGVEISAGRIKAHFWLALPGVLLLAVPLLIGGVRQGLKLANADTAFLETTKAAMMWFRLGTVGEFLIALGTLVFLGNVLALIGSYYRTLAKAALAEATALQPAEVKS